MTPTNLFFEKKGRQITVELAQLFAVEFVQAWTVPKDTMLVTSALCTGIPVQIQLP